MTGKSKKRSSAPDGPFRESALAAHEAFRESMRCLQCFDAPCTEACAAHVPIPRFVRMIRSGNVWGAAEVVRAAHPLIVTCGEICPDENLCQSACTRGKLDFPVRIRQLHAFATAGGHDPEARADDAEGAAGARVAVVGGGPAGLSCASFLARAGVHVDLYEREAGLGGILASQIPEFRLSPRAMMRDVRKALAANVSVKKRKTVKNLGELAAGYDAVFVGAGAYGEASLGLPGERLGGVMQSSRFLSALRSGGMKKPGTVVVIGGGNVALDCAVAALHAGADRAAIHYRRSFTQMPGWKREMEMALKAGVEFEMLSIPLGFAGSRGRLRAARFMRARLGRPGKDGRKMPVKIPGTAYSVPCDTAVIAAGQRPDAGLMSEIFGKGPLRFDAKTMRASGNIYVGGDLAGRGTIVEAVGDGMKAAEAILERIRSKKPRRGAGGGS